MIINVKRGGGGVKAQKDCFKVEIWLKITDYKQSEIYFFGGDSQYQLLFALPPYLIWSNPTISKG